VKCLSDTQGKAFKGLSHEPKNSQNWTSSLIFSSMIMSEQFTVAFEIAWLQTEVYNFAPGMAK
jgi:hypothetical protein